MKDLNLSDLLTERSSGFLQLGGARMALLDIESGFWGIRRQMEALLGTRLTNSVLQQAGVNGGASFAKSFIPGRQLTEPASFSACLRAYQSAGFGSFEITQIDWPSCRIGVRAANSFEAWMMERRGQACDASCCAYTAGVLVGFVNVIAGRTDLVCTETYCQAKGDDFCQFDLLPGGEVRDQAVVAYSPDPGLGRRINLLEMLFERMPMGIAVLDREYRLQRYNPTWKDFANRYAPPSGAPLSPGVAYFEHLPGTEPIILPMFERVLAGETVQQNGVRLESDRSVSYWDVTLAPLLENGRVAGILSVAVDATERVEARQDLEQRVAARTRETNILLEVASAANRSLDLDATLGATLDLLINLIEASRVVVMMIDGPSGSLRARMIRPDQIIPAVELVKITQACDSVVGSGEPVFVAPDIELDFAEPGALLPLKIQERVLGVLVIIGHQGGRFTSDQQKLFQSIADQLSIAIDNARLYEEVERAAVTMERSRLARDLHDAVTQTLFSASLIAEVLPIIWEKDQAEGRRRLDEIRQLTRGALSEMRTLLLELRPTAMVDIELDVLISHLVNAFIARSRIAVDYASDGSGVQNPSVKEVFYRIAQEALNNTAKHAEAESVSIDLTSHPDNAKLVIRDDGRGFSQDAVASEKLGLRIMCERAEGIGAQLSLESSQDIGTIIRLTWTASD
ncbi:MAG: histidine kinase [Anaerolineales bacterium]